MMIELPATNKFPRCFKHSAFGHFGGHSYATYYIRCDSRHVTTFVYSNGTEELWSHDSCKLAECLEMVKSGRWTEFSIPKEIVRIPIRVVMT